MLALDAGCSVQCCFHVLYQRVFQPGSVGSPGEVLRLIPGGVFTIGRPRLVGAAQGEDFVLLRALVLRLESVKKA
ncbi:hypothetical protein [Streptomyces sp. NBC_00140]|uniref:hypothetical protein n=1 Tax=Streptomyces sp. NBC_00140 TaxID=2975664 RepID=UPI0022513D73|nr:hypothetical protein [Streptomyces sp. NBC_00140]MCX5336462.1 hypothetical protein [Streptomyces sp. NBC_00140]